jgi:hypothetical protein
MQKFHVFLSHITVESTMADALQRHLERDFIGLVEVFESSDRLSIPVGSKWLDEVTQALKRADLHLILCSPDATKRPWIQFEAGAAHLRGIPIIPICHSGLTLAQLPVPLSEYEGLQITKADDIQALYRMIATALGSDIPKVDFQVLEKEMAAIDAVYAKEQALTGTVLDPQGSVERISNPKALCISSRQFNKLGFENQLQIVLNAFPAVVPHQRVFTSSELREAIMDDGKFDIVHIAAYVCPRTGDLYFTDVDENSGRSVVAEPDLLSADALASLLQLAETKLVVIGGCDSTVLAALLVGICHVVASRDMASARMMAAWVKAFYDKLPRQSLMEALDYARKVSQAPMRFYARQRGKVDMVFMQETDRTAASARDIN